MIFVLLLGAVAIASAQAQPPTPVVPAPAPPAAPAPPPVKVATNVKFGPKRDEYNRKQSELQTLRDQLKKGQATMSAEALRTLNQSIDNKSREVQRLGQDSQTALEEEEGAMMQQLGDKLMAVVRDYATRNGYAVVIDVSLPNGPVLWASPSVDITNEIVKLYDQTHPVAAAAPPAKKQ